ncbi:MAG TPA: DUF929 family protein [Acidimicrobiales bacterium]|nr:DUF929 family protein [Acidimicrobiales bacterium]
MADNDQPNRSAEAKERSRQQSRAVSGKDVARGVSGQPAGGQRTTPKGSRNGAQGTQGKAQGTQGKGAGKGGQGVGGKRPAGGGQRSPRPGGRPAGATGPRRSSTALLTWGVVGLVLIVVIVLVVVKLTSGSSSPGTAPTSQPLPATIAQQVTDIPASVYDTVGISSPTVTVTPPKVLKNQPLLTFNGQPGVFYMGGEFCPYCAAQRWAIVASLSRFGKFTGLGTMQSSSTDVYANTQTLTFAKATFSSPYVAVRLREYYSNVQNSSGTGYTILNPLNATEKKLVKKFDVGKYTGASTSSGGSIPFMDIGNKVLVAGASYTPAVLSGLTRAQIAGGLTTAKNPVTQAVIATSNYLSAATCASDGNKPASVCGSKGVTEAAKAMGLKS